VPTTRRRHAITETPPVQSALDELRAYLNTDKVELGELVILGARAKLQQLRASSGEVSARRDRLVQRILDRDIPVDAAAADEVRRSGWARP
jgi:hypothetical protein